MFRYLISAPNITYWSASNNSVCGLSRPDSWTILRNSPKFYKIFFPDPPPFPTGAFLTYSKLLACIQMLKIKE